MKQSDEFQAILGCPEFKSSTMFVNCQLVCLRPVGVVNPVMFYLKYLFLIILCRVLVN